MGVWFVVSAESLTPMGETGFDRVLSFTVPQRNARGRLVRLGPVLDTILSAHDYPASIRHLLGEGLVLTALMGALLKDEQSQLTLQAMAEGGVVDLLVSDYRDGELRGYARHDAERLGKVGVNPSLDSLFGTGYFAITFDLATSGERYQGVVPLEGDSLAQACEAYFARSEQVPTLIRVGVRNSAEGIVASGLLLQHFPEAEVGSERLHLKEDDPEWEHVATLAASIRHEELVDPGLSLEQLVWRLFHQEQEVRVEAHEQLSRGCRCTVEHYRKILARFPESELVDMRSASGFIPVDCAFCSRILEIDL
jgi:molecular chaperone Hsp33